MDNMLDKIMKLVVTVREDYLGTLVDLLEKVAGRDAEKWMKNLRLFLRKESVDWNDKVKNTIRNLKNLALKEVVTVPGYSFKRADFLAGKLGWKLYKGYGFSKIEAELQQYETISCPMHSREVFTLTKNMYDSEIQAELNQPSYPTVEEVVASFISRINMWASHKSSKHGLLVDGYANIEHARASDGRVVAVDCYFGGGEWVFSCSGLDEDGRWLGGRQFSCAQAL